MIVDGDLQELERTALAEKYGFNGAVDDRRRRLGVQVGLLQQTRASMGPSMIVDGDTSDQSGLVLVCALQWGRR